MNKQLVSISIESVSDGQIYAQSAEGELYFREGSVYIRYQEPDLTLGDVKTTVKVREDLIKVNRHGSLESEQTFILNTKTVGFYQTTQGDFELAIFTREMNIDLVDGYGHAYWVYDLWMGEDAVGELSLKLEIRPRDPIYG